jgi:hypothetical protein
MVGLAAAVLTHPPITMVEPVLWGKEMLAALELEIQHTDIQPVAVEAQVQAVQLQLMHNRVRAVLEKFLQSQVTPTAVVVAVDAMVEDHQEVV